MNRQQRRGVGRARRAALALLIAGTLAAGAMPGGLAAGEPDISGDYLQVQGGGGGGGAPSSGGGGGGGAYIEYAENASSFHYAFGGGGKGGDGFSGGGSIGGGFGSYIDVASAGGASGAFAGGVFGYNTGGKGAEGNGGDVPDAADLDLSNIGSDFHDGVPVSSSSGAPAWMAASVSVGDDFSGKGGNGGSATIELGSVSLDRLTLISGENGENDYIGTGGNVEFSAKRLTAKNIHLLTNCGFYGDSERYYYGRDSGWITFDVDTLVSREGHTLEVGNNIYSYAVISVSTFEFDLTGTRDGSEMLTTIGHVFDTSYLWELHEMTDIYGPPGITLKNPEKSNLKIGDIVSLIVPFTDSDNGFGDGWLTPHTVTVAASNGTTYKFSIYYSPGFERPYPDIPSPYDTPTNYIGALVAELIDIASPSNPSGPAVYTVTFNSKGGSAVANQSVTRGNLATRPADPTKDDCYFEGWYTDEDLTTLFDFSSPITRSITLYASWSDLEKIDEPELPYTPFITDDHFVFINGYPDNSVRPESEMTRAEAAQMIFNLLADKSPGEESIDFSDVIEGNWFYRAINVLASRGIINGDPGGEFLPNDSITRAEFTALFSRFFDYLDAEIGFTDIDSGHWAYEDIANAVARGWITGYEDSTFQPDEFITRAEVITIANRALSRVGDTEFIDTAEGVRTFTDLTSSHWAYYEIMEAANAHDFDIDDEGEEIWTALK